MKTREVRKSWYRLYALLGMFSLAGCTITFNPPTHPVAGYVSTSKTPLNVELRLSEELRAAKWKGTRAGDTFVIPLGEALAKNAEVVARELFANVVVTNGTTGPAQAGVDAVLTPRMVSAEQTMVIWAFEEQVLTVMLEWILKDPQGNLVWVDTVKGEGETNMGTVFTGISNGQERVKKMLEDLFHKSFQVMSSSRAIRDFAATRQTANAKGP